MSNVTMFFIMVAVLMVAFLFVDATSGKRRSQKVMAIEFGVFVLALVIALVTYLLGGM